MAKDEPKKPDLTETQIKMAVDGLGRSPITMKRYFAQQLLAFAADNNGEIDITNKQFADGIASLKTQTKEKQLQNNPNFTGGVLSLAQAEIDMREGVKEAVSRGADPALFEPAKALLVSVKDELTDKLQSNEGAASLVGEFIKDQSLVNGIPFINAEAGRGLVPQEKADLVGKLMPYVKFPDNVSPFITKDTTFVPNVVSPKVQARMAEFFSVEGKLSEFGSCTFDQSKLTPENMKKFGDMVSKDLEIISVVEQSKKELESKSTSIIEQSIKELEEKGYKVSQGTKKEIAKQLMPVLNSLGSEYLEANKGGLAKELAASLDKGKSFSSRFKKEFDIAEGDLKSVATKMGTGHLTKSNEAAVEQYKSQFLKIKKIGVVGVGTDKDLSEKLNKVLEGRGEKPISLEQFKKLSDKELALHRKTDPKEFDKLVFGIGAEPVVAKVKPVVEQQPVVPPKPEIIAPPLLPEGPSRPVITPPIQVKPSAPKLENTNAVATPQKATLSEADKLVKEIIDSSIKAEGHKITPERVEKITKALAPTLARLGSEYLGQNKDDLTKELTASLKSGQGYSTSLTGSYTVSTAELGKIASKMKAQHQPQAQAASVEKVETALFKNVMSNSDVATKLNSFVKEARVTKNGKAVEEFSAKTVPDNATIAQIRLTNPKKFDSIFNPPKHPSKLPPDLVQQVSVVRQTLPHPPPPGKGSGDGRSKPVNGIRLIDVIH